MTLKKPADFFQGKEEVIFQENYNSLMNSVEKNSVGFVKTFDKFKTNLDKIDDLSETFDKFKDNIEKIDQLSYEVKTLSDELTDKLTKKDLDNAMVSHLMLVNENFNMIKDQVNGLNKSDLKEFKNGINYLKGIVDNLISEEMPKYKKKITGIEINLTDSFSEYQRQINEKVNDYHNAIIEFTGILQLIEREVSDNTDKFEQYKEELTERFNRQIEEQSNISNKIYNDSKLHKQELDRKYQSFVGDVEEKVSDVKADVIINENHLKKVENFILKNHNHIVELKKEVFNEISKLSLEDINDNIGRIQNKINYIEEVYIKINSENIIKETLPESLVAEPAGKDNSDPLTPLDQNFVTQKDLQEHYRLFVNRVQQQLASLGGGGETQLKYLDDVVGIATNASQYDGKFLKYDHSIRKFVFDDSSSITVSDTIPADPVQGDLWYDSTLGRTFIYYVDQDGAQWVDASPSGGVLSNSNSWISTNVGIHTLSSVGIGTTNPTSKLTVVGGDIRVGIDTSEGVILTSPNGTKYRLVVDNSGVLSTVLVP